MISRRRYKEINFDEAIATSVSNPERMELATRAHVFHLIFFFSLLIAVIFAGRVLEIGVLKAAFYATKAERNINKEIVTVAPRGIIADRYNEPLVENGAVFSAFLNVRTMLQEGERDLAVEAITQVLGRPEEEVVDKFSKVDIEGASEILIAQDIKREEVIKLESRNIESISIQSDYKRKYLDSAFSHIIGYVGLPNKKDLEKNPRLSLIDVIGRAGLEGFYDEYLKGKSGKKIIYKNAEEIPEEIKEVEPSEPGKTLKTTIDGEFQRFFHKSLERGIASRGQTSAVGIAINPQNGEVLALTSLPTFDANNISKYLGDTRKPLFNRAISGIYNPGSTIKPLHAVAALREGVIDLGTRIYSKGYIEVPNPYDPEKPSRFVDWRPQGWVDVRSALAKSSNIFFYAALGGLPSNEKDIITDHGKPGGVGITKINEYWREFGLGSKSGIDILGEANSFLPNPTFKEKNQNQRWRLGDTYNIAIGQGDLLITPIQLINYISAVAAKGKIYKPHFIADKEPEVLVDLSKYEKEIKEAERGMIDSVYKDYGTSFKMADLPMKIAAKTGTAQTNLNTKTNALFVGYGPIREGITPEIAILVLIENAKEGSLNAIPIAKEVFDWYYKNRLKAKS